VTDRIEEVFLKHRKKFDEIFKRGANAIYKIGVLNNRMIFVNANARLPVDLQIPEAELAALDSIMKEGHDETT